MDENVLLALGLTLIAGLATGVGSLIAFFTSRTNTKFFLHCIRILGRGNDLRFAC